MARTPRPRAPQGSNENNRRGSHEDSTGIRDVCTFAATITGNVAVVQYHYMVASENLKKDRKTITGHYTDVLIKENGKWMFIAWAGGDDAEQ